MRTRFLPVFACGGVLVSSVGLAQEPPPQEGVHYKSFAEKLAAEDKVDAKHDATAEKREELEHESRVARSKEWINTLDPLPGGGWSLRNYTDDWSAALYSSNHQRKRVGNIVTLWLRWEHRDPQTSRTGEHFLSLVQKVEFDCDGVRSRVLSSTSYTERNLGGSLESYDVDPKVSQWTAVIPGSQGEFNLRFACH